MQLGEKLKTHHGRCGSPIYHSWLSMRQRCLNPNATGFHNYGGRGIKFCKQWDSFKNFFAEIIAEIGPRPKGKSLDRYPDNNGDYKPGNVRWATPKQQQNNKRKRGPHTLETRTKMSATARNRSVEHRAKISAALKGRKLSSEWRAKMSAAHTGRKRLEITGRKQTPEHIAKRVAGRLAAIARRQSEMRITQ